MLLFLLGIIKQLLLPFDKGQLTICTTTQNTIYIRKHQPFQVT